MINTFYLNFQSPPGTRGQVLRPTLPSRFISKKEGSWAAVG